MLISNGFEDLAHAIMSYKFAGCELVKSQFTSPSSKKNTSPGPRPGSVAYVCSSKIQGESCPWADPQELESPKREGHTHNLDIRADQYLTREGCNLPKVAVIPMHVILLNPTVPLGYATTRQNNRLEHRSSS